MRKVKVERKILLNPGPATTTDTVKYAQVVSDICPREKEFGKVMEFISKGLTSLVGPVEEYTSILFGGSGTAAIESIISSVVDDKYILIVNNGAYGARMCEMAKIYGLNYIEFKSSNKTRINIQKLRNIIEEHKDEISHLAAVHHETTTGILNDIKGIGNLCKDYDIDFIVDAMSSFAGIPIDMKEMNIKYLASSSNKCIQGMAGVSFVIANINSLKDLKHIKARTLYLNLYKQYLYFEENYQMRFTPPVQVLYALKQAIIEVKKESVQKRSERYKLCARVLWQGLEELQLKRLVSDEDSSMLLTSVIEPKIKGYDFDKLHDYLYKKGFTIYPGKIGEEDTFRIANIGDIYPENIRKFIDILKEFFEVNIPN